jgi:phage terminase large subunit-like protein
MTKFPDSLMSCEQRSLLIKTLETEQKRRHDRTRLFRYRPYPKQRMFHAAGREHDERLLMAANQVGKTTAGAAECALHLTGLYEEWEKATGLAWKGRRWDRATRGWAGCDTWDNTRDGVQRLLVGPPRIAEEWGTGLIPGECLADVSRRPGVPDSLDGIVVRHKSGGLSTLSFKSYDQGRRKWQGETLDFVWFDEEPPEDIYTEGKTRTNATGGIVWLTFTPVLGMSSVVLSFKDAAGDKF